MKRPIIVYATALMLMVVTHTAFAAAQETPENLRQTYIRGRVLSPFGPVENVRVRLPGDKNYALTDRQGHFELPTGPIRGRNQRITAGKEDWFNNGTFLDASGDAGTLVLNPVHRGDQPHYRFISPVTCSRCHVKVTRYWDRSKMAHTTSNPRLWDIYYGTDSQKQSGIEPGFKLDNPGDDGNCIQCHAPSAAAFNPAAGDLQGVLMNPRTEWDGISCDYCHKIRDVIRKETGPSGRKAVLERQSPSRGSSILVFGPFDDVAVPPMAASYNPLYEQGRYCSVCHSHVRKLAQGRTWNRPAVYTDDEWNGFGLESDRQLPVQTTFQEWRQWQESLAPGDGNKGKKCQDCHMSWRKEMLPYEEYIVDDHARAMWGSRRAPQTISPHHFDGGTAIQLKTALAMEIEGDIQDNLLTLNVFITNTNGGHWVPTGETMRSVLLQLDVFDGKGQPLPLIQGETLPAWAPVDDTRSPGSRAGRPGAVFARVLTDDEGNLNVPFWRATGIAADTRIRPKKTVTLTYQFRLTDPEDEPSAEARLIYRPVHRSLAAAKKWQVDDIPITSVAW